MCCSFYWYLPRIKSSPTGYQGLTTIPTHETAPLLGGKEMQKHSFSNSKLPCYPRIPIFLCNLKSQIGFQGPNHDNIHLNINIENIYT